MFNWILKVFDPEWGKAYMHTPEMKQCRDGIRWLAVYYFIQIMLFRLSADVNVYFTDLLKVDSVRFAQFSKIDFYSQYFQILGTILGAIIGYIYFDRQRRNQWAKRESLRKLMNISFGVYTVGMLSSVLYYYFAHKNQVQYDYFWTCTLYVNRCIWGLGWACGIGAAILWVCEYLPPFLRTSGGLFIGFSGFLGGGIAGITVYFLPLRSTFTFNTLLLFLLATAVVGLVVLWNKLPKDSSLNYIYSPENDETGHPVNTQKTGTFFEEFQRHRKSFANWVTSIPKMKIVIPCLIVGATVQFFSYIVRVSHTKIYAHALRDDITLVDSKEKKHSDFDVLISYDMNNAINALLNSAYPKPRIDPQNSKSLFNSIRDTGPMRIGLLAGTRYLGMCVGMYLFARWTLRRKNAVFRKRILPTLRVLRWQFAFLLLWLLVWRYGFNFYDSCVGAILFALLCGIVGCTWIPALLATAEQFSLRDRPFWVLLAPDFYRMADLILITRTGNAVHYSGNTTVAIFLWGLIFVTFAIFAILQMEDNFESDPVYLASDQSLSTNVIRQNIRDIENKDVPAKEYIEQIAPMLIDEFKKETVLGAQIYTANLQYKTQKGWEYAAFKMLNQRAYQVYRRNESSSNLPDPHLISNKLIKEGVFASVTEAIASEKNKNILIGLIWYSEIDYPQYPDEPNYLSLNLSSIQVNNLDQCINQLRGFKSDEQLEEMVAYFRNIEVAAESYTMIKNLGLFGHKEDAERDELNKRLVKTLAFFRVDAALHASGRYFITIIRPYSNNPEVMMVIKTVVPLNKRRLDDLRSLTTFIESGKKSIEMQISKREEIKKEQEIAEVKIKAARLEEGEKIRAQETHSLKHTLSYLKKESDNPKTLARELLPTIQFVSDVINFNLAIHQASDGKAWTQNMKEIFGIKAVSIRDSIMEVVRELSGSIQEITFSQNAHRDAIRAYLEGVLGGTVSIFEDNALLDLKVYVIPVGWRIILTDLLKNALKYSDDETPEVKIGFHQVNDESYHLTISNNQYMLPANAEAFQNRDSAFRLGLHTIDRIIGFNGFTVGDRRITLDYDPRSTDRKLGKTIIYLNIPTPSVSYV